MSPPSKLAVAAARMALRCAGISASDEDGTAVVIATAFGPSTNTEALLKQILDEGPEAASPSLFMESVANAPAAQIAIALKARGSSVTVCQREAGPLIALGTGAAEIAAGRAGRVLAGSVDEMTPLLHALLDRFGALARAGEGGEELARPFDLRRGGFLAGEGATVVVLESAESLAARGGRALARVLARGSAFDPTAPPSGWGHGYRALARSLRRTLERAGLEPGDVDLVVSGASGAREGDRLEAEVLRAVWEGAPLPPVAAPKAVTGEYGGGHLAAAVLAAAGSSLGSTPGFAEEDPELGITPLNGSPREAPSVVLATSLAAGGAAAWVVLGRG
jgi:3-oxoacyl-(acyl-carrier-protein) synthase